MAPSRMEPRRHASIPEETTESRTMEGMVFNPDKNSLRVAMSEVGKSMTDADGTADPGGRNGMRLTKNAIGAVYELALDAEYKAGSMSALVWGKPT